MKHKIEFICNQKFSNLPQPYVNIKNFPEWFSKTEKIKCPFSFLHDNSVKKKSNIKGCPGVFDFLSYGYAIPAWTNFLFRNINDGLHVNWEDGETSNYALHDSSQFSGMNTEELPLYDGFHKMDSPWFIKTSPGISCLITHPYWNRDNRFTSVSAIIHPDISPIQIKWFFEWNFELSETEINYEFQTIKRGQPLIYILPFKRQTYSMNINYVSSTKIEQIKTKILHSTHDWFGKSAYNQARKTIGRLFF